MPSWLHSFVAGSIGLAVLLLFSQTFTYPFLSWDDQDVFVRNAAWHAPRFAVWAFTTTYVEHYQPLAWLTWGAVDRAWGLTPSAAHALNVGLHAMCAVLVFALALRLCGRAAAAALAALLFALHRFVSRWSRGRARCRTRSLCCSRCSRRSRFWTREGGVR